MKIIHERHDREYVISRGGVEYTETHLAIGTEPEDPAERYYRLKNFGRELPLKDTFQDDVFVLGSVQ